MSVRGKLECQPEIGRLPATELGIFPAIRRLGSRQHRRADLPEVPGSAPRPVYSIHCRLRMFCSCHGLSTSSRSVKSSPRP